MSQPNNLRRCHTILDQDSSLIAVVEMSQSRWLVAGIVPRILRQPAKKLKPMALLGLLRRWQDKAAKAERRISRLAARGFGLPIGPLQRTPIEACEERHSVQCHRRLLNFATAGLFLWQSPILETSAHLKRGFDDLCRFQAWQLQRLPMIDKAFREMHDMGVRVQ
jgi:hypothetical protein